MMSLLLALAAQTKASQPVAPLDTTGFTALRQVVDNCAWYRFSARAGASGATTVVKHTVRSDTKALRMRRGVQTTTVGGLSGRAALVVDGAVHWLTWGGAERLALPVGEYATSDPLSEAVVARAGSTIFSVWEAAPDSHYPTRAHSVPERVSGEFSGGFDGLTMLDTKRFDGGLVARAPQGIYGLTDPGERKSFACLGDSIVESGWMRGAAAANNMAWADLSLWLEEIPDKGIVGRLSPGDPQVFQLALSEYGTNSNRAGGLAGADDSKAKLIASWKWLTAGPVKRLGQTTMVPYTTSTDGFATIEGQRAEAATIIWRDEMNAWLRDGAPMTSGTAAPTGTAGALRAGDAGHPLVGICDIAAAAEVKNSHGEWVWREGGANDGVHPTGRGAGYMQPTVTQWIADNA